MSTEFYTEPITREGLIKGERLHYDVCSENDLEYAKNWYGDKFSYIGSGKTYFINGTRNQSSRVIHFFIKK